MNKTDLINVVSQEAGIIKRDAERAINATIAAIEKAVADGDKVTIVDFGIFEAKARAAKKGRNPQTKEEIVIPATTVPAFKPGKGFKDAVK